MHTKYGIAAVMVAALWLGGCATGTTTEPPVDDKTGAGAGDGAGTQALSGGGMEGSALGGTAADADLLAKRRVHFGYDSSSLDEESRRIVESHAKYLASNPNLKVQLEGHADERGTREYNLALGERRAQAVERLMRVLGVGQNRVAVSSYGEEKPMAQGHEESSWAMNRRVELQYK